MKKNKLFFVGLLALIVMFMITLAGCSNVTAEKPQKEIAPELRNTVWARQIGSETATLTLGRDALSVSGCGNPEWNGKWYCGRAGDASCCGGKGRSGLAGFQYTCYDDTLCISGCNGGMSWLNGDWTRVQ